MLWLVGESISTPVPPTESLFTGLLFYLWISIRPGRSLDSQKGHAAALLNVSGAELDIFCFEGMDG